MPPAAAVVVDWKPRSVPLRVEFPWGVVAAGCCHHPQENPDGVVHSTWVVLVGEVLGHLALAADGWVLCCLGAAADGPSSWIVDTHDLREDRVRKLACIVRASFLPSSDEPLGGTPFEAAAEASSFHPQELHEEEVAAVAVEVAAVVAERLLHQWAGYWGLMEPPCWPPLAAAGAVQEPIRHQLPPVLLGCRELEEER